MESHTIEFRIILGQTSAVMQEFHLGKADGDDTCLFWSFLDGIMPLLKEIFGDIPFTKDLMDVLNGGLRMLVVDYIRNHPELQKMIRSSFPEYGSIKAYCSKIEQGRLWGGEPELRALSDIYNIIICVINPKIKNKKNCILPFYYGQNNPLAKKCIYIYYNGKDHYDPLYVGNTKDINIRETMFDPNDQMTNDLLKKFIKDKFHHKGDIQLGFNTNIHMNDSNKIQIKSNLVPSNIPIKRKETGLDDIAISSNNDKQLSISISEKYYVTNKRVKVAHHIPDQMSPFYANTSKTTPIENLIQVNDIPDESGIRNSQLETRMILNDEHQEEDELIDDPQENVECNNNSESSNTKPAP